VVTAEYTGRLSIQRSDTSHRMGIKNETGKKETAREEVNEVS
jgi:hypothetical protein